MQWSELELLAFLDYEIKYLESLLEQHDTGHIRTAIDVLRSHMNQLMASLS
jgi:hypothetical protein